MVKLAKGDWVVVCDGGKALFLENAGSTVAPVLEVREEFQDDNPPTHEQGSDRPGRSFQSADQRRSAVGQTDWHAQEEQRFLARIADRLDQAVAGGKIRRITVVAPPRALGIIRAALSPAVKSVIAAEVAKDYVMMPVDEITRLLSE